MTKLSATSSERDRAVQLLRWPEHRQKRAWCQARGLPRVLVVDLGHPPPITDMYEDWVRAGTAPEDVHLRRQTLARRVEDLNSPQIDLSGVLVYRGNCMTLSPTQTELTRYMIGQFGQVVSRSALASRLNGDNEDPKRRNVLDLHIGRLRRRIAPLGLSIRTVWGCGYVLESDGI